MDCYVTKNVKSGIFAKANDILELVAGIERNLPACTAFRAMPGE